MTTVLGLDIGGSGSRARLVVDGRIVAEASAGSASVTAAGPEAAAASLRELVARLGLVRAGSGMDGAARASGASRASEAGGVAGGYEAPRASEAGGVAGGDEAPRATEAGGAAGMRGESRGGMVTDSVDAVCAAAAGSEVAGAAAWLTAQLQELTRARRVSVVADAALLLPAAGHRTGIAIVCGTGSIVHASDGRRVARAGGWGYLLGDEGGGYRLVAEALRTVLARRDRGEPLGPLGETLAPDGDLDAILADLYADGRPCRWAARAPAVLACGDPVLDQLLRDVMTVLADQAAAAAGRLGLTAAPIVLAGGLIAVRAVRAALDDALAVVLPAAGFPVEVLTEPPVAGAVRLAEALADRAPAPTSAPAPVSAPAPTSAPGDGDAPGDG